MAKQELNGASVECLALLWDFLSLLGRKVSNLRSAIGLPQHDANVLKCCEGMAGESGERL